MPDLKISALPPASALLGTEEIAIVQGGITSRSSISAIAALIAAATEEEQINTSFTGTNFTLTYTPIKVFGVFVNGQRFTNGVDFNVVGNDIVFVTACAADSVTVFYKHL